MLIVVFIFTAFSFLEKIDLDMSRSFLIGGRQFRFQGFRRFEFLLKGFFSLCFPAP